MKRREFVAGSVAALPVLRAREMSKFGLVPCINQAQLAAEYRVRTALEFIARSRLLGSLRVSKLEDLADLRPGEVEHVHFHDVPRAVPRELLVDADRIPPGRGVIPLAKVVCAMDATCSRVSGPEVMLTV